MRFTLLLASILASPLTAIQDLTLATFSNATATAVWSELNDPVMGGQSVGTWTVLESTGLFQGTVKNVTFLQAPGFCEVETKSPLLINASAYANGGIKLTLRTMTPEYKGFKFAFNAIGAPNHHGSHAATGSYKTPFKLTSTNWTTLELPFAHFSSDWSDYTGECTTQDPDGYQHVCCDPVQSPQVCPDATRLARISGFSFWAEGAEGDYKLEVALISAYDAMSVGTPGPL